LVENFKTTFSHLIDNSKLVKLARESKFLVRKSKITPAMFLDMMFYGIGCDSKSLRLMTFHAQQKHFMGLSKQAIDNRFSKASTSFAKALLKEALSTQVRTMIEPTVLDLFRTVRIKDSTTFGIDASLSDLFEGYRKGGGRSSKAAVSIQFEYDLKTGNVFDIDLQSAVSSDITDVISKKDDIKEGDLIIRDLGYYSAKMIQDYINKEAFFISKLNPNLAVRNSPEEDKIDFRDLYDQMTARGLSRLDKVVYIGKGKQQVRLITELVPESICQQRVRRRNQENKVSGCNTSDEFKARAHFNLYICNIEVADCSSDSILKLYRMRWQIELMFKIWKSIMHIDLIPKMKRERFLTTLYLKLFWVFLNWQLIADLRNHLYKTTNKMLSPFKCFTTIKEMGEQLRNAIFKNKQKLREILWKIFENLSHGNWVEKRKERCNFVEIFDLIFCRSIN